MVLGIAMTYKLVLSIVISVGGVVITWLFNMFILQKWPLKFYILFIYVLF